MVQVLRSVYEAMGNHALNDRPNECCGLLAGTNGVITQIYHATNVAEMVYFAATGEHLADRQRGKDTSTIGAGDLG